ncbi:MAG: adenine phosphoribosyltransferase [Spirochaetota bacterium]|nr:adenine phosphoribosyltransferase [Spirochaetota bacterium]
MKDLKDYIRNIVDFPEKGIIFRDITSVLENSESLKLAIDSMQAQINGLNFDVIAGPESRGFIFGMPLAYNLRKSFVPVRKKGKLPCETVSVEYSLEYGDKTVIEIHKTAVKPGQKVVIIDDLLATGGTTEAAVKLVEKLGGEVVGAVFLIELTDLNGREKIKNIPNVYSVVKY